MKTTTLDHPLLLITFVLIYIFVTESSGLSYVSRSTRNRALRPMSQAFLQLPEPSTSSLSPALPSQTSSSSVSSPSILCDFDSFEKGCEDEIGSVCDTSSQRCVCKEGYPIRLLAYCLAPKAIGQDCYTSSQCKDIDQTACFIFGKEYDNERISGGHNVGRQVSNWPTGMCRCNIGYQFDNSSRTCIKKTIGSWCNDDWDCIKDKFNTQCSRPQNLCECSWGFYYDPKTDSCQVPKLYGLKCTSNQDCSDEALICSETTFRCTCPSGTHFDPIHPGCKPNDDSSCDSGYKWDQEWGRCIPIRSPGSAFPFNQINRNSATSSKDSNRNRDNSLDPTLKVNSTDSSAEESTTLSTILLLVLPNAVAFVVIIRCCYYRKQEEDALERDLERAGGPGLMHIRSAHNFPKFCAYPPYGRPTLMHGFVGPCCTGPTGKLHAGAKLAVLEAVAEEGKLDSTLTLNGGVDGETAVGKSDSTADSATAVVEKQDSNASGSTSDVKTDNPEASEAGSDGVSDRKEEDTVTESKKEDRPSLSSSSPSDKKHSDSSITGVSQDESLAKKKTEAEETCHDLSASSSHPLSQQPNNHPDQSIVVEGDCKTSFFREESPLPPPPEFEASRNDRDSNDKPDAEASSSSQ